MRIVFRIHITELAATSWAKLIDRGPRFTALHSTRGNFHCSASHDRPHPKSHTKLPPAKAGGLAQLESMWNQWGQLSLSLIN